MIIKDSEFGDIMVRKGARARAVRFSVGPSGQLRVSAPKLMPNFVIKQLIATQRREIKRLLVSIPKPTSKKNIEKLREKVRSTLTPRVEQLAKQHGFQYKKLRFSTATTRWGSCSSRGTVSLNIALANLPDKLVDYVILHELTHTEHMNHSKQFWSKLEQVCPGSKELKKQIAKQRPIL